ncbi:MAG: hypothetical protein NVS2B3_12310 [Vulcanimicrobiaceae bacterium]
MISPRPRFGWTLTTVVAGVAFFVAALNNDFYQLTSPVALSWHVTLRKAYSIVAFAVVAFLIRKSLGERGMPVRSAAIVAGAAVFSGAIEVGQYLNGSTEGLAWNVTDIACGALGGVVASLDLFRRGRKAPNRIAPSPSGGGDLR